MRNNPFTFTLWLQLLFHQAHWDQTEESLCPSLGSGPTLAQGPSVLAPLLFGTTFHYLSAQPPRLPLSEDVSKLPFRLGLPTPVNTGMPNGLLMLWNDFNDFLFEHRSGCRATETAYAGNIGAIFDWLINLVVFHAFKIRNQILSNKLYCIAVPPYVVYVLPLYPRQATDAFGINWIELNCKNGPFHY